MQYKDHLLLQFSIITFAVTLIVSYTTGIWIGAQNKNHLIRSHMEMFNQLVDHMIENDLRTESFFLSDTQSEIPNRIQDHMEMIYKIDSVFKITLLNMKNRVLWSDRPELIGRQLDGKSIVSAEIDNLEYKILQPDEFEYKDYSGSFEGHIFEIDVPINHNNTVIGILKIYESDAELNAGIHRLVVVNRIIMAIAGMIIYILLFSIFAQSYKRQIKITKQIKTTEDVTIYALAYQAGLRDEETGQHLKRTQEYVRIIAENLSKIKSFKKYLNKSYIDDLVKSAPLHDIGKVGIEDSILRKPGKLTVEEFDRIKEHSELGAKILEEALVELSFRSFLDIAIQLIRHHHEKWDGTGYPHGLKGNDIPLSARIMSIADVYDALRSKRYYKDSIPHEECIEIIRKGKGSQFDPDIVDAFIRREKDFFMISETMKD